MLQGLLVVERFNGRRLNEGKVNNDGGHQDVVRWGTQSTCRCG